ncbi:hypothetical protein OK015_19790 [Mycobacterium sp. Aquia_216]|uniref:hypothetical protein n=1 Tax=Mycobacterium sp. Aquia_216 TaxID=2991729 RepID=UPI00227A63B4|nr:hypothetical protein [Mycobacterium sp. Aquia_216]WAJ43439.1 hypothetical protein OK015_19790 [Mycobacterium sp. Aquia_216]
MTVIDITDAWGPLAEPIHFAAAGPTDPVWKDNAYLSFWDIENEVFGSFHVSTSPNGTGARRARCSVSVRAKVLEIIEDLPPGSFASESIDFGLGGVISVRHPRLRADLVNAPLFVPADYAVGGVVPELVPGKPLQHFQQACELTGTLVLDGAESPVQARGMRDRTWGFRDESAQWIEYAGLVAVVGDTFITVMKFLGADGALRSDGFLIDADGLRTIADVTFGRNAAGQFRLARLRDKEGGVGLVTLSSRLAGFFVPMGADSEGPSFGTYDDFMTLDSENSTGAGFFEQGILHRVF